MPSPFVKPGAANLSRQEMTDREPLEPMTEAYEGTNIPYRGVMYHGVEPTEKPEPPEGYEGQLAVDFLEPEEIQQAVPVRVVNKTDRFFRDARANTFTLEINKPVNIAAREDSRISLKIVNLHATQTVYVGFSVNMATWNGAYALGAGKDVLTVSKDEVWVLSPTGGEVVSWIADYEVPIDDN